MGEYGNIVYWDAFPNKYVDASLSYQNLKVIEETNPHSQNLLISLETIKTKGSYQPFISSTSNIKDSAIPEI